MIRFLRSTWGLALMSWLYLTCTQPSGLMWFDSGELALAGHTWGLGHPPGQPFYQWLAALTSYTSQPLWTLNQLSAISLALCLPALWSLWTSLSHRSQSNAHAHDRAIPLSYWVLGAIWVSLYPVWDQGARIELYSLGLCLGLWSLSALHRSTPHLLWSGLLLGLCGATQPIFAVGFGLAALPHMLRLLTSGSMRHRERAVSALRYTIGVLLGFLTPHLYLWYAVTSSDGFVWGNWDSWQAVSDYMRGRDYRLNRYEWSMIPDNLSSWIEWARARGHLGWCLLGALGLIVARDRKLLWWVAPTTVMGALFPLAYQHYQPEVPDFSGYQLPTLAFSLLGLWSLAARLSAPEGRARLAWWITALAGLSAVVATPNLWERARSDHHLPRALARDWLTALPPNALLFVESDHWVFPLMYTQEVEGVRPDVIVFNMGFARSSWYWRRLRRQHPEVPTLAELDPRRTHRPRVSQLAEGYPAVYAESAQLAERVAPQSAPSLIQIQHCASGWGVSVGCAQPTQVPPPDRLLDWAQISSHHDPITQRVLARLGLDLTARLWSERRPREALALGYASLGEPVPREFGDVDLRWRPVSPQVWAEARRGLISDPKTFRLILKSLSAL